MIPANLPQLDTDDDDEPTLLSREDRGLPGLMLLWAVLGGISIWAIAIAIVAAVIWLAGY